MDWAIPSAIGAIIAAFYAGVTSSEQRKTRMDDKFPCMVVRSRKNPDSKVDEIRLVNVGRGPAFMTKFVVKGLDKIYPRKDDQGEPILNDKGEKTCHDYPDGNHIDEIDRVIGPETGNPDLQCWFAWGTPENLRSEKVSIGITYNDVGGREFKSGIIKGKPVWNPPPEFSHSRLCLWLQKFCGKEEASESVKALRTFLASY